MRQPRIPKGTGETRRYLAVGLDCYLCLLVVGLLVHSCLGSPGAGAGRTAAVLVGQLTVLSFANQVLLTMAVRASAGKLIMGVRVIRLPDAGRPEFRRLVVRWLYGLLWLPLQPWHHLRRAATAEPPPRNAWAAAPGRPVHGPGRGAPGPPQRPAVLPGGGGGTHGLRRPTPTRAIPPRPPARATPPRAPAPTASPQPWPRRRTPVRRPER
ncbi:RDD family protein [Streptomyces microflavus]